MLRDTLEALRSKTKIYSSAEQTLEAVEKMETEIRKKIGNMINGNNGIYGGLQLRG